MSRLSMQRERFDESISFIGPSCKKFLGLDAPQEWSQYWAIAYEISTRLVVNVQFTTTGSMSASCVFYRRDKKRVLGMNFDFAIDGISVKGVLIADPSLVLKCQ